MGEATNKSALAEELGVSRSSLYYRPKLSEKDEILRVEIESVMRANPGYGHRRVADALGINRKRALRVMKKFNLKPARRCRTPRKPDDVSKSESGYADITRLLCCIAPDLIWTGDFTFIRYKGQFVFLAVVQERWSAEVLGARVMTRHTKELVIDAFQDALSKHGTRPDYFHSDQGSEYTSEDFISLLTTLNIEISNSPKSSPWRNGSQESFFGRFKIEFGDFDRFDSLEDLMVGIYQYIWYYNQTRIHTRLRCSPACFRQRYEGKKVESRPTLPRLSTASPKTTTPASSYQQN